MAPDSSVALRGVRVLVTGASGFIGKHLCEALVASGADVYGLSRRVVSEFAGTQAFSVDLTDYAAVRLTISRVRPAVIYHLAASVSARREMDLVRPMLETNLVGTVNVLLSATELGCGRIITAGSSEEPRQGEAAAAMSPYGAAKAAGTIYAMMFHQLYDLPVVEVRPCLTYGPMQDGDKLIPHVVRGLMNGTSPSLSSGNQVFDFVFVDDVVDGLLKAGAVPGIEGKSIELGTGVGTSVRAMVELLSEVYCSHILPLFGALPDRPGEVARVADISAAKELLGWQARWALRDGLKRTVDWYKRQSTGSETGDD